MGAVVLLFAVFLLDLCETKGSSTVTPVFVQTGKDLLLDVKEPVTLDDDSDFTWRHNGTINIVKVFGNNKPKIYKEGAESLGNYSLLLKNVQQNDSGTYRALISAAKQRTVAEYKVTVQDPVSAVNLTVNCSSAPNITVTCSTVDSRISSTFRCDNKTCSRERSDATTDPSSIDVYLDEGFIICNHSNHVSSEHKKEIKSVCEPPAVHDGALCLIQTAVPAAVLAPIVICGFLFIIYPVSAVNLTVNCSSAPNITVTCSTVDSRISSTFRCDNKTCSRERSDATTDPSSIDVYLDEGFIICNHSNYVSWEHKKEIKSVCEPPPEAPGSSAVTPVFVKKGDDLLLNVTEDVPQDFIIVVWKFRKNILVSFSPDGKTKVSDAYTGRVETSVKKFSVKLKNLQEADSGVYTARVTGQEEQTLDEYNVTVQAPVSPVGLTVDSVSNSSDSCNLTVTCSTQDSHISSTLRCDTQTCSQEGGERPEVTTSGASLHVYLVKDSIICNHSNQDIVIFDREEKMGATARPADPTNDASGPSPVSEYSLVGLTLDPLRLEGTLCQKAWSSAVTPVFVKKGDDLLLNVTEDVPENFFIVTWKIREKILATFSPDGKPTVSDAYTGRVETSVKKFSVKLKNLQEADSGVYTARVIAQEEQTLDEYNVTVQAPVSPVGLTVDSVSNSSDSCNLTVTCSTQDSHISSTLRCDTQTCSQEGGERPEVTTSGASLHVYLVNDSIICSHSNQVSWTKNMTNIQNFCPQHVGFKQPRNHVITYVIATVGVLVVILSITAGVFKLRQRGTGSSAVTPVFVKKGDDLLLNVTNADNIDDDVVVWNFNKKAVLVRFFPDGKPKVSDAYTGRVETSVKKFSVKLKNLQEADSGVYTARVIGEVQQTLDGYNVTVQAPVSPVGLTVDSVSSSSDSCNLTVTCSTQDSHISSTLRCDTQTCSQEGGERSEVTTSGASLHVYLENDSIICNHSNQVSWTKNMMEIQDFCPQHVGSSAVTPVFVKKGDDLLLNVTEDGDLDDFVVVWNFNKKAVLNLQEADSGVYTAQATGEVEQTLVEYNVTVQAPVSPVGLTVDSVSSSSDSCNLTVTCSTQDSHISSTLRCDTQTCSQEGGERSEVTTSGASLHVYLENDSIICNHSNQVSWTKNMTDIQQPCIDAVGVLAVILIISAGVFKLRQRGTHGEYSLTRVSNK
ncbi:hypothetical protein D5F01_LYC10165 [Larimichthys crocea]|uniref:Ig-like domain-containing protein n=1 Tax=Larimichthys crocea TaxID=215358 RepID=A0A6G0IGD9_LARCR|nr:hypothetical protein D5F01_LYC10165 [Larimichthys crocea]